MFTNEKINEIKKDLREVLRKHDVYLLAEYDSVNEFRYITLKTYTVFNIEEETVTNLGALFA